MYLLCGLWVRDDVHTRSISCKTFQDGIVSLFGNACMDPKMFLVCWNWHTFWMWGVTPQIPESILPFWQNNLVSIQCVALWKEKFATVESLGHNFVASKEHQTRENVGGGHIHNWPGCLYLWQEELQEHLSTQSFNTVTFPNKEMWTLWHTQKDVKCSFREKENNNVFFSLRYPKRF